jgi:nucleoid-associated protein YgaU
MKPTPRVKPLQLTIRRPDTPLELAPQIDISPAAGWKMTAIEQAEAMGSPSALPTAPNPALENLAPPPALPVSFHPTLPPAQPNDWRPDTVMKPTVQPRPPRQYRIRDRDTLELIAERLLGNRQRASEIFEANRNVLSRPDLLPVGRTILLPPRDQRSDLEPVAGSR